MLGHANDSSVLGYGIEKNGFGSAAAERAIEITKSVIDLANIDNTMRGIAAREVKICFDEWNVWDDGKADKTSLEQIYDLTRTISLDDALEEQGDIPIAMKRRPFVCARRRLW